MSEQSPSARHLKWSIEGRASTQLITLKLLEYIKTAREDYESLQEDIEILTAVSFSLWRAVFLADRKIADVALHATAFLEKMLTDNTINFSIDRLNRGWTFLYYVEAAEYNLEILAPYWPTVQRALSDRPARNTARNRWDRAQSAFAAAVEQFRKETRKDSK